MSQVNQSYCLLLSCPLLRQLLPLLLLLLLCQLRCCVWLVDLVQLLHFAGFVAVLATWRACFY